MTNQRKLIKYIAGNGLTVRKGILKRYTKDVHKQFPKESKTYKYMKTVLSH